jgi:hypothetical protein
MTKKHPKPISLYPLSPDEALRAALLTPPEKKRAVRADMRITEDKIEVFKEEAEGGDKGKPGKEQGKAGK